MGNIENTLKNLNNFYPQLIRQECFNNKIVIVDGLPGCGKSMLSAIVASFDRVELLTLSYEIEYICTLHYLNKIEMATAETMVRILTDLLIYNTMMSREVNFRPTDVSSVFRDSRPWRYFKRLFQKGDSSVPERIARERPILHLTTHQLAAISQPIFSALGSRVIFIELVRHPLYMVKQHAANMEYVTSDVRDFDIQLMYQDKQVPFYALGWEDLFIRSNAVERGIYFIEKFTKIAGKTKKSLSEMCKAQILTIPFESFVINPESFLKQMEDMLETKVTALTRRILKRQKVPRKLYADGIGLKVYKRCGWEPPKNGSDENREFALRRTFVKEQGASLEAMQALDRLCAEYEEKYLGGKKSY